MNTWTNKIVLKKLKNIINSIHPVCNIFTYYKRQIDITARGSMCDDIAGQIFSNNKKRKTEFIWLRECSILHTGLTFDG